MTVVEVLIRVGLGLLALALTVVLTGVLRGRSGIAGRIASRMDRIGLIESTRLVQVGLILVYFLLIFVLFA